MFNKTLVRIAITVIFVVGGYCLYVLGGRTRGTLHPTPPEVSPAPPATTGGAVSSTPREVVPVIDRNPKQALKDLIGRWTVEAGNGSGAARQGNLQNLCGEAISRLGASNELVEFLQFIKTRGASAQRDWVLDVGLRNLFTGPQAAKAREQMLTVTDETMRATFCNRAGEGFGALGFKEYLDSLAGTPHAGCQSPLLAGRCMALARNDLASAVYAFRELKTGSINHTCLGEVFAEVLKDTDYPGAKAALKALPEDLRQEAITGLRGKQGKNVGPYLAALDEIIHTEEWPKIQPALCVKLHNLVIGSSEHDTLRAWAAIIPERKDTEDLYRVTVRGFTTYQRDKARKWIESLPPGWRKQNALAGFMQASLMTHGDIPSTQWARAQITEPAFIQEGDGWILEYEKRWGKPYPR